MNKLIAKFGYQKVKWGTIGLTCLMAIFFVVSVVLMIKTYQEINSFTTLTL